MADPLLLFGWWFGRILWSGKYFPGVLIAVSAQEHLTDLVPAKGNGFSRQRYNCQRIFGLMV